MPGSIRGERGRIGGGRVAEIKLAAIRDAVPVPIKVKARRPGKIQPERPDGGRVARHAQQHFDTVAHREADARRKALRLLEAGHTGELICRRARAAAMRRHRGRESRSRDRHRQRAIRRWHVAKPHICRGRTTRRASIRRRAEGRAHKFSARTKQLRVGAGILHDRVRRIRHDARVQIKRAPLQRHIDHAFVRVIGENPQHRALRPGGRRIKGDHDGNGARRLNARHIGDADNGKLIRLRPGQKDAAHLQRRKRTLIRDRNQPRRGASGGHVLDAHIRHQRRDVYLGRIWIDANSQ